MPRLRTIMAAVTILAVAGGPVAAQLAPCCCAEAHSRAGSECCLQTQHKAGACCNEHSAGQIVADCCCVRPLPTAPIPTEPTAPLSADTLPLAVDPAALSPTGTITESGLERCMSAGEKSPIRPPLSVLFCVWLK